MARTKILIIEDHSDTRRFLESMLNREFDVICAENAIIGIDHARNQHPDIILLDIMLPILSGHDACSIMKGDEKTKHIPIIFLSAKGTVNDITHGLGQGADDYLAKPFDFKELLTRIQVRLRNSAENVVQPLQVGDLKIKPVEREVSFAGKPVALTNTEFDILRFLAMRAGQVVSRANILKEVWGNETGGSNGQGETSTNDRTIDVHIRALRKKLPPLTRHIISIYGVGYKYEK
jgi:DNA-binding response OmpR family regulator